MASEAIVYLERIQGSEKLPVYIRNVLAILLAAINDWPSPMINLTDYENEVYRLIGENVDRKKLDDYISTIDYSKNAWEAESFSQLIEVYNYYEAEKPLKEILREVLKEIKAS